MTDLDDLKLQAVDSIEGLKACFPKSEKLRGTVFIRDPENPRMTVLVSDDSEIEALLSGFVKTDR